MRAAVRVRWLLRPRSNHAACDECATPPGRKRSPAATQVGSDRDDRSVAEAKARRDHRPKMKEVVGPLGTAGTQIVTVENEKGQRRIRSAGSRHRRGRKMKRSSGCRSRRPSCVHRARRDRMARRLVPAAAGPTSEPPVLTISSRLPAPAERTSITTSPAAGARGSGGVSASGVVRAWIPPGAGRWVIAGTGRIDALESSAIGSPGTR